MGLKMKNVNIMGVHQLLGEGDHKKKIYGELPKKGAWQKIRRRVFLRGFHTSMHTIT